MPSASTTRVLYGALPTDGTTVDASTSRKNTLLPRISMPGYHVFVSVNVVTGAWAAMSVQYSLNGSAGSSSKHSRNGLVGTRPNAAFEDCGRDGMLFSVLGSLTAASPVRRNGS